MSCDVDLEMTVTKVLAGEIETMVQISDNAGRAVPLRSDNTQIYYNFEVT